MSDEPPDGRSDVGDDGTATRGERRRTLAATSLTLVASVLAWFNYPAVLPTVAAEWELSGAVAGALFAAFQAGYVVAIVPAGRLADRFPTRWVIAAGTVGSAVGTLGFALTAAGPVAGGLWRALAGACTAGVYVPGMRFVADWFDGEGRGRAMGVYVGSFSAGSAAAYALGPPLTNAVGWRLALAATGAGGLVAGPLLVAATREHPNAARPGGGFELGALRRRTYGYAVGVYAGHNWELFAVRAWIGAFLLSAPAIAGRPNGETLAGAIAGVVIAAGAAGNLVGGTLSDRLGRARTVAAVLAGGSLITVSASLLGDLPLGLLVAVVTVWGVLLTADSAPTSTAVTESVPDEHVGVALSLQSVAGFSVTLVSPVAFGAVLDRAGYALAFPTAALGGVVALGFAFLFGRARAAEVAADSDAERERYRGHDTDGDRVHDPDEEPSGGERNTASSSRYRNG